MKDFASAVIGTTENGLNMEQRKLVSIGIELAAKPPCLLFLDEPTSGLNSQSSLAIVTLLQRLSKSGMAILATIHQPSAILLQKFDEIIFLAKGGKTAYFGDIGPNSKTVIDYFVGHGARECEDSENPAEYLMEVMATRTEDGVDWARMWMSSERKRVQEVKRNRILASMKNMITITRKDNSRSHFATPTHVQLLYTVIRVFWQHWRTPSYIMGKLVLGIVSSL